MTHDPLAWIQAELAALESRSLLRRPAVRSEAQAPVVLLDGERLVNFGSNDYLGLAGAALCLAVRECVARSGWGGGASPLVTGRCQWHAALEAELARFERTEAALLFSSGFAANIGTIAALAGESDVIFSDARNHASIIDGCRLSRARVEIYQHGDADHLERLLRSAAGCRRRLIVTDSLFSMDGDLAPLAALSDLAQRHDAMLLADEAHATGVFGPDGRGVAEHLGVEERVHVKIGTLSKALGSVGGFAAGPRPLIEWLANRARTYVFSTAPPPAAAAAALEALRIVREQPGRRTELLRRAARLRQRLQQQGWRLVDSPSQIVPLVIGDPAAAMQLAAELRRRGLFVPGIRPPTVPQGYCLLRISLTWSHSEEMIERLIAALADLGHQHGAP